jgi:hypothetical protein
MGTLELLPNYSVILKLLGKKISRLSWRCGSSGGVSAFKHKALGSNPVSNTHKQVYV